MGIIIKIIIIIVCILIFKFLLDLFCEQMYPIWYSEFVNKNILCKKTMTILWIIISLICIILALSK